MRRRLIAILSAVVLLAGGQAHAQQFNSDSYLSKDPGVATIILTGGARNGTLMTTFSLLPKWEFTVAAFLYNDDENKATNDGYSTTFYAKYMFYENNAKTGGAAIKFGTGVRPGEAAAADATGQGAFRTFWVNAPMTLPLLDNKVSVDLMPGVSVTRDYTAAENIAWGFTYSGRVAWYPRNPKWSIVGEVFGTEGQTTAIPEYKAGLRWEPNPFQVWAFTYGKEFNGDGTNDAKFEVGLMLFTKPFFCIRGCN
jgi:hypothetical protein